MALEQNGVKLTEMTDYENANERFVRIIMPEYVHALITSDAM